MNQYLSVTRQVPEFVRAEYPAFIEFLQAYYKWLEDEYSVGKVGDVTDLDNTVDGFLQYFRQQLDVHGITVNTTDTNYLKNIKQLYTSKGTFAGIEFLFKILYNKNSTVLQPWDYVFKPSEGKWNQDTSILAILTTGQVSSIVGNPIVVTDTDGKTYKTYVRNYNQRSTGIVELFVSRFTPQSKLVRFATEDGSVVGNILNTTTKAQIQRSGSGFRVGQVFAVDSVTGSGSLIKVKSVNADGGITALDIITFGTGYAANFNTFISPTDAVDVASIGARIQLGAFSYPTDDNATAQNERGEIIRHDYTNIANQYVEDPTYVGETVAEIKSQQGVVYENDQYALVLLRVGNLCVYPGYYSTSDNIIGDAIFIQDSTYYQAFSYVTVIEESLDKYGSLLRRVLHPAGTKHFAQFQVNNQFALNIAIDPQLNLISKADAIRDFISAVDDLITFNIQRLLADTFSVADVINTTTVFNRSFSNAVSITESSSKSIGINLTTELVNITDSIAIVPGIILQSEIQITDTQFSLSTDKYQTDNVQTSNGISGVYMTPFYVLQSDPTPYWEAGYLENERPITN